MSIDAGRLVELLSERDEGSASCIGIDLREYGPLAKPDPDAIGSAVQLAFFLEEGCVALDLDGMRTARRILVNSAQLWAALKEAGVPWVR